MPRFLFPTKKHLSQIANFDRIGQKGLNREMRKIFISILPIVLYTMDSVALTVTCADKGESCTIEPENQDNITTLSNCDYLSQITNHPVLISNDGINSLWSKCASKLKKVNCEYGIKYLDNDNQVLVFCETNKPTILYKTDVIADSTFSMSYKQKQCVGSDGIWKNGTCICPTNSKNNTNDTELRNDECVCKTGNTKYRISGNCHEGSACRSTGGIHDENTDTCICPKTMESVKLYTDSDTMICQCKSGYRYRDPTRRWEGCVSATNETINISGTVKDENNSPLPQVNISWYDEDGNPKGIAANDDGYFTAQVPNTAYVQFRYVGYTSNTFAATDLKPNQDIILYTDATQLNEVTVTPDATEAPVNQNDTPLLGENECPKSGGTWDSQNSQCVCNRKEYLETTTEKSGDKSYSVCKCIAGYKRANGDYTDKCIDAGDTIIEKVPDYTKMREKAEEAYQAARNHEQSWANKGLTAATTLATGEGAMAATQAYFEQRADADAERDMAAYLTTFKCEYGDGKNFNAGNEEIFLPGGNELLEYYTEYKTLADSVKQTKAALGLRAGIESDVLYDRAQSGLYQYGSVGKQSGANISLATALMDAESEDAAKWNAQKEQTAKDLKTGTQIAVAGAAAGVVANYFINRNYKPDELKQEFKEISKRLENKWPQIFVPNDITQDEEEEIVPTETIATQTFETMTKQLSSATFNSGKLTLSNEGQQALSNLVTEVKNLLKDPKYAQAQLIINTEASTDRQPLTAATKKALGITSKGSGNQELSEKRAETIMNSLMKEFAGVSNVSRGEAIGYGDNNCTDTTTGKALIGNQPNCRTLKVTIYDNYKPD